MAVCTPHPRKTVGRPISDKDCKSKGIWAFQIRKKREKRTWPCHALLCLLKLTQEAAVMKPQQSNYDFTYVGGGGLYLIEVIDIE